VDDENDDLDRDADVWRRATYARSDAILISGESARSAILHGLRTLVFESWASLYVHDGHVDRCSQVDSEQSP